MKSHSHFWIGSVAVLASCVLAGCATDKSALEKTGTTWVIPPPSVIYVADFCLDATQIEQKTMLGVERPGLLANRPHLLHSNDPDAKSQKLTNVLSDSIVKHLKSKGLTAEYLPSVLPDCKSEAVGLMQFAPGSVPLPKAGWLVLGWFEKVEEGQAAVEATVGFGAGAGKAQADVAVADLAHNSGQPFLILGSGSRTRRMPGGVVTLNPYVIAAKFVIERRKGTEKDVKNLGTAIAKSIVQYIEHGPEQSPEKRSL